MDDYKDLPSQAFMMKMMMEMSSKITSLEAKLFNVLTAQHKINENHNAYTKKETLSILNKQEKEDVECVKEEENVKIIDEWFSDLNIKTADVNIILNKKMLRGLTIIINNILKQEDAPIKKIGDRLYYYNNDKWYEFKECEINNFIESVRKMILKKFNDIYNKRHPVNKEKFLQKSSMSHSQQMKYLEQVKIMTDKSIEAEQVASIVLK